MRKNKQQKRQERLTKALKKQRARTHVGGIMHYQKTPGQSPLSIVEDMLNKGMIPPNNKIVYATDSATIEAMNALSCQTTKDFIYTEYVSKRVNEIQSTQGSACAHAFTIASLYFAEYESIYSGIKVLLRKAGLENRVDSYLKSMTFYVLVKDCRNIMPPECYCIRDVKTLLFYLGGTFLSKIDSTVNCLLMNKDYTLTLDMSIPGFTIQMLNKCAAFLTDIRASIKIISSLDGTIPSTVASHVNNQKARPMTMDDFVMANMSNPQFIHLSDYFDEILDYAVINDLFNDYKAFS